MYVPVGQCFLAMETGWMPSLRELKVDAQPSSTSDRRQGMSSATVTGWSRLILQIFIWHFRILNEIDRRWSGKTLLYCSHGSYLTSVTNNQHQMGRCPSWLSDRPTEPAKHFWYCIFQKESKGTCQGALYNYSLKEFLLWICWISHFWWLQYFWSTPSWRWTWWDGELVGWRKREGKNIDILAFPYIHSGTHGIHT